LHDVQQGDQWDDRVVIQWGVLQLIQEIEDISVYSKAQEISIEAPDLEAPRLRVAIDKIEPVLLCEDKVALDEVQPLAVTSP
jgi:hypothetical protein